jgi:hypothetical protein
MANSYERLQFEQRNQLDEKDRSNPKKAAAG